MSVTLEAMVERKGIDVHALRIYRLKSPIFSGVCPYDGSFPVQVESKPGSLQNHGTFISARLSCFADCLRAFNEIAETGQEIRL